MVDKSHWSKIWPHPYSPSEEDVQLYKNYMVEGTSLLLGCTRQLVNLSNKQMDIDPFLDAPTVIVGDWTKNTTYYDNIIGDGVVNFTKELEEKLLKMSSKYCKRFIVRAFNYKLDKMRIAANFPKAEDFSIKPTEIKKFKEYTFFVWHF